MNKVIFALVLMSILLIGGKARNCWECTTESDHPTPLDCKNITCASDENFCMKWERVMTNPFNNNEVTNTIVTFDCISVAEIANKKCHQLYPLGSEDSSENTTEPYLRDDHCQLTLCYKDLCNTEDVCNTEQAIRNNAGQETPIFLMVATVISLYQLLI